MDGSYQFVQAAVDKEREQFASAHAYPFLISGDALVSPQLRQTAVGMVLPKFDDSATVQSETPPHAEPGLLVLPVRKLQPVYPSMITVGRTPNHDLTIPDAQVSKFHAFFRITDRGLELCDAGSRNGTSVGGKKLVPRGEGVILRSGEVVSFGRLSFHFVDAGAAWALLRRLSRRERG